MRGPRLVIDMEDFGYLSGWGVIFSMVTIASTPVPCGASKLLIVQANRYIIEWTPIARSGVRIVNADIRGGQSPSLQAGSLGQVKEWWSCFIGSIYSAKSFPPLSLTCLPLVKSYINVVTCQLPAKTITSTRTNRPTKHITKTLAPPPRFTKVYRTVTKTGKPYVPLTQHTPSIQSWSLTSTTPPTITITATSTKIDTTVLTDKTTIVDLRTITKIEYNDVIDVKTITQ